MTYRVEISEGQGVSVSAGIMGSNLEMGIFTNRVLLSERLDNPKFAGPEGPSGIAPGWLPRGLHYGPGQYKLVQGMGMNGGEAQLVLVYADRSSGSLLQTGRKIKAGERLEAEIWAMVRHQPATIEVSLRPLAASAPDYCVQQLKIDSAYWKKYTVVLDCPASDPEAVFVVAVQGPGAVYFDQIHLRPLNEPGVNQELQELINSLELPNLRFPGGCTSVSYHWRKGTGPVHLREVCQDPVNKGRLEYDFGFEEYLEMCCKHGIQPFLAINIGTGTPDEAGEWAQYCTDWYSQRGIEPPVIYFQMGNEHYGRWELAHMDAAMYVQALQAFVPRVRQGYAKARIVVLGEPISIGVWQPDSLWREEVLKEAKELFDVISLNRYKGQWHVEPEKQMINAADSAQKIVTDLRELIADCRKHGSSARVALTEWNYWTTASHWDGKDFYEPDDVRHGMFYVGMIQALARLAPDMEVANYYHLINIMGMVRNDNSEISETSIAKLYRLYRPVFPGEMVPVKLEQPEWEDGAQMVDAFAIRSKGSLWLYLSNRSSCRSAKVELPSLEWRSANKMSAKDTNSPMEITEPPSAGAAVELPPLSLIRIEF
ncbi:hypothetical protein [Paenibacillus eucommiae]|uniref:Alpha-L-arabinofuranosidase n=1 Tax=Paenibacillus eucommiae TaxID=1355755 RepID=A0ABS4IWU3_9BACL|nr:hypothetical protein [Paenibacillus eucommiae]MBP1992060.1 alpha-L-arabinofuranosidase [Paenibacillus eucommiae]